MTESDWLGCDRVRPMLEFLEQGASLRKLRLFSVACLRSNAQLMSRPELVYKYHVAELFADDPAALAEVRKEWNDEPSWPERAYEWAFAVAAATTRSAPDAVSTALLREIFGNPFRAVPFDAAWRTAGVTAVAGRIYAENVFAELPILADALEDAGCAEDELLGHLRGGGEHVRGCWALDVVLARE